MLPAPVSILPNDAFPDEVTTRYEPQQEYWAYIQSLQSTPATQAPRLTPAEAEARGALLKAPSVLTAEALGPASHQSPLHKLTQRTPAPNLSLRASVPPPLPTRQVAPASGPRTRVAVSSVSVPPPHVASATPAPVSARPSSVARVQESGITQTLVPIEVTQAILACCTDFLGPAARLILAGELRRLGVTPQTIPWSQIPGLISGITAHLDTARAVHSFSRTVQFCHPSLGSYWERGSR